MIGSLLAPACKAWLRSQVSQVESLEVDITGKSRLILGGMIPQVSVVATGAVYEGLSLGSIDLIAQNIQIDLQSVIKGQPLRLLAPINVLVEAKFTAVDLQASLAAPLLAQAISDLFAQILAVDQTGWIVNWHQIQIGSRALILQGNLTLEAQPPTAIEISMGINLQDGHILQLDPIEISCSIKDLPGRDITQYQIDLGSDVNITQLTLTPGELICRCQIQVNP